MCLCVRMCVRKKERERDSVKCKVVDCKLFHMFAAPVKLAYCSRISYIWNAAVLTMQIEPSVSADTWPFVGLNAHVGPSKSILLSSPVTNYTFKTSARPKKHFEGKGATFDAYLLTFTSVGCMCHFKFL